MKKESKDAREPIERELADSQGRATASPLRWGRRRLRSSVWKEITRGIDDLKREAEREERQGNLGRVAEIRYGELPALERELAERDGATTDTMVKEEVDEDDVAAVVARWTGIPVDRLLEGETEKLIHMEERLHQRIVGQHEAVEGSRTRSARAPGCRIRTGRSARRLLDPTGVGKTELARYRGVHVRRRSRDGAARRVGVPGAAHGRG
jgi:ATP-dependent Clp protease ATP-binding subunit ClpB